MFINYSSTASFIHGETLEKVKINLSIIDIWTIQPSKLISLSCHVQKISFLRDTK
ncbi:hypothetical protein RYX36_003950, partial [Vicia faba]